MFDIGWTELLVLAVIAILIVGPKDLPRMLYALGQTVGKMRRQADEFRRQFNESMREAGMDDVRNDMKKISDLNPANQVRNEIESTFSDNPTRGTGTASGEEKASSSDTGSGQAAEGDLLDQSDRAEPASPAPQHPAEPGATEPQPQPGETRSEPKPVSGRNTNGAAEASDAVS